MEALLNKKYTIEMEVLTPLHIGAGSEKDWMKGADFIQHEGKVYVLSQQKLLQKMPAEELANYLVKKDDRGLKNKISGALEEVADWVFESPVETQNDIKTFIKNGLTSKPIVPGSSIKGAIRSSLLEYFLNGKKPARLDQKSIFGDSNKGDEFMRFVKVADAEFDNTTLVNTKIFNLRGQAPELQGGWKHSGGKHGKTDGTFKPTGFNTVYEVIKPGEAGRVTIALAYKAFENLINSNVHLSYNDKEKKKSIVANDIQQSLFAIINEHTRKYIDKQIAFFQKYSNNETENIISNLEHVKEQIPDDNSSCVLQMSAGSGFHSITGDWQFDDFSVERIEDNRGRSLAKKKGKKTAKSRKIAIDGDNFYLMGFVKLSVLDEETLAKREAQKQAKIEAERKAGQERIAKEKARQERIEAEKKAKEEAERKAEEERLAREKAGQQERERLLRQRAEEEKRRQEANEQKLEKGLALLETEGNYYQGRKLIIKYKKRTGKLGENDLSLIKSFVEKHFDASDKDWTKFKNGKKWKDVQGWAGREIAQQWFKELLK